DRDTSAVNVPLHPKRRPATDVVRADTSPVTAHLPVPETATPPAEVTQVEEELVARNAISVVRLDTSPETAPRDTAPVDMAVVLVATEVAMVATVNKLATLVVVSATWLATARRDKSATTAAKLVTSPETAPPKSRASVFATNASSPATSRQPAPTKHLKKSWVGAS
ncbi:hypothetical protein ACO22_07601, partial [Paracoccidioides brasiliensis]